MEVNTFDYELKRKFFLLPTSCLATKDGKVIGKTLLHLQIFSRIFEKFHSNFTAKFQLLSVKVSPSLLANYDVYMKEQLGPLPRNRGFVLE